MAKSLRSKVKRSFRSKKREEGVYAAHNAARLHRLNNKLLDIVAKDPEQAQPSEETAAEPDQVMDAQPETSDMMPVDSSASETRVSTHGPRNSRRDEWRKSKGMSVRPPPTAMNRQGGLAGRRKSGRSKRRR